MQRGIVACTIERMCLWGDDERCVSITAQAALSWMLFEDLAMPLQSLRRASACSMLIDVALSFRGKGGW